MRLLDAFCGAGGAGMGYRRAGLEVVGVDIALQPHYPFEFCQADALEMAAHGVDDPDAARLLLDAHQDAELIRTTAIQVRTLAGGAPYQPRR